MPITGRTPRIALNEFRDLLNRLLNLTITEARLIGAITPGYGSATGRMELAFRDPLTGLPTAVPLRSRRFGEVGLSLAQRCETSFNDVDAHQVATVSYRYCLELPGQSEPMLRWEYLRKWPNETPPARWCRHHLQGPTMLPLGQGTSMNDLHLPGYVVVEDVIRFCIVDLDVQPLSSNWHKLLEQSYERF